MVIYISYNPNITWEIIQENPDKPWNYFELSKNSNITWDIIQANLDKPWNWKGLSCNPNITWENVKANPTKPWNWYSLSWNPFKKNKEWFMNRKYRELMAAFKIQTRWRKANEDPNYTLCKRRVNREYDVMCAEYADYYTKKRIN